jgi:hypothetical protein
MSKGIIEIVHVMHDVATILENAAVELRDAAEELYLIDYVDAYLEQQKGEPAEGVGRNPDTASSSEEGGSL